MNPTVILCPVEFSASGTAAFAQAVELARYYDAKLHVVNVTGGRARRWQAREPLGNDGVDDRLSSFRGAVNTDGVRLSTVALAGDPVTAVSEHADLISADLVVVAKHGRRHGFYWRPGVYAKDLARAVSCPTIAVPEGVLHGAKGSFSEILCPMDFSPASAAALGQALILAQQNGGRLTLLHVIDGSPGETADSGGAAVRLIEEHHARVDGISRQMRAAVPREFRLCNVATKVVSGVAHRSILAIAMQLDADLIVMGMPERSGVDRVIMASIATPVLRAAGCPVLMVPLTSGRDVSRATAAAAVTLDGLTEFATGSVSVELSGAQTINA